MEEQSKEYQFVPCQCGKTLRLKISEKNYGREVITVCPNCKTEHRVTILPPKIPSDILNADFEEIRPYAEMLADKLYQYLADFGNKKDFADLRALFLEKGFYVELAVSLSILKNTSEPKSKISEAESDADFLKKMKISYD